MENKDIKPLVAEYVKTAAEVVSLAHDLIFGKDHEVMNKAAAVGRKLVNAGLIKESDLEDTVEALSDHKQALQILDNVLRKEASRRSDTLGRAYGNGERPSSRPRFIGERVYGEVTEADRALMRHLFGESLI